MVIQLHGCYKEHGDRFEVFPPPSAFDNADEKCENFFLWGSRSAKTSLWSEETWSFSVGPFGGGEGDLHLQNKPFFYNL